MNLNYYDINTKLYCRILIMLYIMNLVINGEFG